MGPLVRGFITTYFSWHWNFFINVPIGFIGIALALKFIPDIRVRGLPPATCPGFIIAFGLGIAQFAIQAPRPPHARSMTEVLLTPAQPRFS
jgi:MFS family permease